MIEVQDVETLVRGAKHDFLAIEGSKMDGQDELLEDVVQAISVLKPEALVYFKEHQPGKGGMYNQITQYLSQSNTLPLTALEPNKSDAADSAIRTSGINGAADQTAQAAVNNNMESAIQSSGEATAR